MTMASTPSSTTDLLDPASRDATVAAAGLERLRGFRVKSGRNLGIEGVIAGIRREARRHQSGGGAFVEAWESVVPENLREGSRIRSLRGGVVKIEVPTSATRYELDAFLRGGGLAELRLAFGQPLRRVQFEITGRA